MEFLGTRRELITKKLRPRISNLILNEISSVTKKRSKKLIGRKLAWNRISSFAASYGFGPMFFTQRVSSGRAAPKRWYTVTDVRFRQGVIGLGPSVFDAVDPTMLDESLKDNYPFIIPTPRKPKIEETIHSVLRELDIATKIEPSKLSPYHSSINVDDSYTGISSNLIDVGYGASQVIPIIMTCLSETTAPLIVEQPEIHLHPKAQGIIADLLCRTSKHRQVFIETHSVHMINRARILIAKGEIKAEDVIVNYIDRTSKGSRVRNIGIMHNGDFADPWPEGFFDERYEDTLNLLSLKNSQEH